MPLRALMVSKTPPLPRDEERSLNFTAQNLGLKAELVLQVSMKGSIAWFCLES